MKNLIKHLMMIVVFGATVDCVSAAYWYVRPAGGLYGTTNGTSYANAWAGFNQIRWGAGGVVAGDVLYVCGQHCQTLDVETSGTAPARLYIRGNYAGDPGVFLGWKPFQTNQWTSLGDGRYIYDTRVDPGFRQTCGRGFFLGETSQLIASDSNCLDGMWYKNPNISGQNGEAYKIYFRPPTGGSPSSYNVAYSFVDHAITISNQQYIYVSAITAKGHNTYGTSGSPNAVIWAKGATNQINYIVVENSTIRDAPFGSGVQIEHGNTAYIRGNEIYNCLTGIYLSDSTTASYIQRNHIHNIGQHNRWVGADEYGIAVGSSGNNNNNTVEYNDIHNVGSGATGLAYDAACAGWSASADQMNVWRYNEIHDNYGGGLNLGNYCGGSVVSYNLIYQNGNETNASTNGGIYLGNSHTSTASVYIYNNTVINNSVRDVETEAQIYGHYNDPTKVQMKNNIIYTKPGSMAFIVPYPTNLVSDYNIFYADGGTDPLIKINGWSYTTNTFATYQAQWGQDAHSTTLDPMLNSDLTLQATSPAIDRGVILSATFANGLSSASVWPNSVILLDQNGFGSGWEIGAFAY